MSKPEPARYRTINWSDYNAAPQERVVADLFGQGDGLLRATRRQPRSPCGFFEFHSVSIKALFELPLRPTA